MVGISICNMLEAEMYSTIRRHDPKSAPPSVAFVILPRPAVSSCCYVEDP